MNSGAGDWTQLQPGFPIRTPWDHSSVDSSPRPIAASHVLHRLLVPRHPPSALDNLTTKMLASTMQFSTNNQPANHQPHTNNHHNGPGMRSPVTPGTQTTTTPPSNTPTQVVPSGPNRVPHHQTPAAPTPTPPHHPQPQKKDRWYQAGKAVATSPTSQCLRPRAPHHHTTGQCRLHTRFHGMVLLRKEVIQPHLPVRLPCYDFVPIASPTFDHSLRTSRLGHGLRVLPTFVT